MIPLLTTPVFAQVQIMPTDDGTLNVGLTTIPAEIAEGDAVKLQIDFLNPQTENIQVHIDYELGVIKDGRMVFGPIPLTHTSTGSVTIPAIDAASKGEYIVVVGVEGILFQPMPLETATFTVTVGDDVPEPPQNGDGGCLIATAAYGSELAPQVQQLRETRDNLVLQTESGIAFMNMFNQLYYSFSPAIADLEREYPAFREAVKIAITPMLFTLSILNHVEIDSEWEMLALGMGVILVNLGIYLLLPLLLILKIARRTRLRSIHETRGCAQVLP